MITSALVIAAALAWVHAGELEGSRRHTLFIDFAGGEIEPGEDTAQGQAPCIPRAFRYPMFLGSGSAAESAIEEARRILAPYGVVVRASPPPPELPFTHVRVGGSPELFNVEEGLNGLSCRGIDCGDASESDTAFVFSDKYTLSATVIDPENERAAGIAVGRIAVHEAAHSWGLEHSGASDSIMAKFPSGAPDQSFLRGCLPLDVVLDSVCPGEHGAHCSAGEQDAHAELIARFGPGGVDEVPPVLEILSPADGEEVLTGTEVSLEVEVSDDRGTAGWSLSVPELSFRWAAPPGERVRDLVLPEGTFTLRVDAIDPDGNLATKSVTVRAAGPEDPLEPPSSACACAPGPRSSRPSWLAAVLALGLGAIRRRASSTRRAARRARVGDW